MKKIFAMVIAAIFFSINAANVANAARADNPSCALMKFTNDTRYDKIGAAELLSGFVLEKMANSKKFNFRGAEVIDEGLEQKLYDEKIGAFTKFNEAISSDDYNEFFEGDGFQETKAQSIATAYVGQIITPELTSEVGKIYGAEYLVQGTIVNLGTGTWMNEDLEIISGAVTGLAVAAASYASNALSGGLSGLMGDVGGVSVTVQGIGVQCDVRLIKAATGEVVWSKRVLGLGESKMVNIGLVSFGHANLSSTLYTKAMDRAAEKIVASMVEDMENGKLFLK